MTTRRIWTYWHQGWESAPVIVQQCVDSWIRLNPDHEVGALDRFGRRWNTDPESSVIVDRGKLVSVCSMNMQFRGELIPAVHQLPMHVEVMPNWVVDRYGDIWGGFILKTLMRPYLRHLCRALDTWNASLS